MKKTNKRIVLLYILLSFISTNIFAQKNIEHRLFFAAGIHDKYINNDLVVNGIVNNYFCNQIGFDAFIKLNKSIGLNFGAKIIQNRHKWEFGLLGINQIITKSFLSSPIMLSIELNNNNKVRYFINTGICIDLYLYAYTNEKTENQFDNFNFKCIEWSKRNYPISIHLETEFGTILTLKDRDIGVSINFQIFEIASLYGRNYSVDMQGNKDYFYPISASLGFSYFLK